MIKELMISELGFRTFGLHRMQNTGLKDRFGKQIFECDILEWPVSKETAVVKYCIQYAAFRLVNEKHDLNVSLPLNIGDKGLAEVIGNIHHTPELLI